MGGGGYGTIENRRLRILFLAAPDQADVARGAARALASRHDAEVFAPAKGGFGARLSAARAVSELKPDLVHAFGSEGVAKAAGAVTAGARVPFVLTIGASDLAKRSARHTEKLIRVASAVTVETAADADALRNLGIDREIYVTTNPDIEPGEADRFFLGAIEIVYGRLFESDGSSACENEAKNTDGAKSDGEDLVRIGGLSDEGRS